LATDPASEKLLDRKPDKKTAALFSVDMDKQILFQSSYQIAIILIFHYVGGHILSKELIGTLLSNTFVFAQIFNSVVAWTTS
jgi:Ca2+-transporting ATPase